MSGKHCRRKIRGRLIDQTKLRYPLLIGTAMEIAAETKTSDATVIRAIQAPGFAGLRDLKQTMEHWFGAGVSSAEKMASTVNALSCDIDSSIDFVMEGYQRASEILVAPQNRRAIAEAVSLLVAGEKVAIFGIGASGILAEYATRLFNRIGIRACALNRTGVGLAKQLINLQLGDVLLMMVQKTPHHEGLATLNEASDWGSQRSC